MHRNLCSGCGYNYSTMESFEARHVGEFGCASTKIGQSLRRCLTINEMHERGWIYSEPLITFYDDEKPYQKTTPTWTMPIEQSRAKNLYENKGAKGNANMQCS
jgi:hypothetical protein